MDDPMDRAPRPETSEGHALSFGERADLSAIPSFLRGEGTVAVDPSDGSPVARSNFASGTSGGAVRVRAVHVGPPRVLAPDPGALPMVTLSRRRLLHIVAALALAWGVISFGRLVTTASAASSHADELRAANAAITKEVAAMERELTLIQERRYVDQQARAYRLGSPAEVPFALQPNAPLLGPNAPGSASVRLGADPIGSGPLGRWLDILFGPGA